METLTIGISAIVSIILLIWIWIEIRRDKL